MKRTAVLLLSLVVVSFGSCGGGGGGGGNPPPPAVSVSVSPATSTVEIGGTVQFTATVRNTSNTAVTWQVNDIAGGDATVGAISSAGLYTAPASVPSPADVTVKAVSQADTTKSASATVTIKLHIEVAPATATVPTGGTQQFTATVQGVANTTVNWKVNDIAGGNATVGTVTADGLYTAPEAIPSPNTVSVTAVAQADTSKSASATVTIVLSIAVSVSPATSAVEIGGTVQFTATVQNTSNTAVTWQVNDITGGNGTVGTISAAGLYTAPANVPSPATVTVKAVSQADTTAFGSATVTVKLHIEVAPAAATVPTGGTQQFTATVQGVANTAVNWQVNGIAGGDSTVGTITTGGLYTAPLAVPTPSTVTVAAIAQADTSKSASATVTIVLSIAVSVSPATSTVEIGGTVQFTATVRNTSNTAVTWQVNDIAGGDATVGTISSAGLYTAPASVPSPADVTVKAVSQADTTKSASATVTIKLHIEVAPATATVPTGGTQQFTATVQGVTNTAVDWQVNDVAGGNATVGTITADGLYAAPEAIPSPNTVTVTAVAQADTSKSASATVTIVSVAVSVSPATSTVEIGGTVQFTATVQNTSNTAVTWQVNDITGGNGTVGTISAAGLYTAPAAVPSPATVTVKAVSQADATAFGSATVTITPTIAVTPATATVPAGETQQFTATVEGVANTAVNWQVNGVAGGNASVGTISTTGLYTAPLAIPATGTVTITAVSQANTSASAAASATIVFSGAMLSGPYAFSYTGFDADGLFYTAGSFVADGNGTISSGLLDLNAFSGVFSNLTLTGTYTVNPDGRAEILLTDSDSFPYTLRTVLISPNRLHMIQFDTFAGGQGFIEKQDPTAFNNAAFAGGYAIRLNGIDDTSVISLAGRMTADGAGNLTAGVMDINAGGTPTTNATFDGTYDLSAGNGRGTALVNTPTGPVDFAIYMVSASKAYLISTDYVPAFLGTAEMQTLASFSNANVSGDYALTSSGFSANGFILTAGRLTANGSGTVSAGVSDENDQGTLTENLAFTGAYSVTANGRGTGSFTSTRGTSNFAFYMISPSRAVFVQLDDFAVATGELESQQGSPFSVASLAGDYGFSLTGYDSDNVGQFASDGAGAITGTTDVNDPVSGLFPDQAFTATYTMSSNGRGDLIVTASGGTVHFHSYAVSASKALLVGVDTILSGTIEKAVLRS